MLATIDQVSDQSFDYIVIGRSFRFVFHHVIIVVHLTIRIPQVEGYELNLGFNDDTLTPCHRRQASLSPRAYPKIPLRPF